jgi:GntR family transcriptional regulator, sialic acid-inducible nan operon repressor
MSLRIDPFSRRELSDEVLEKLKLLITSGEMCPSDEMPSERELMERFGNGPPAIRDAM